MYWGGVLLGDRTQTHLGQLGEMAAILSLVVAVRVNEFETVAGRI